MNAFPVPFRFIVIILITGIIVFIGALNLGDRIQLHNNTDGIFWIESEGILIATVIEPGSPGSRAGIILGDRLKAINGKKVKNLGTYADLLYEIKPGTLVDYNIEGEQGIRTAKLIVGSKTLLEAKDGLRSVLALLYLGIGIFVILRGNGLPRTLHFYIICLTSFVVYLYSYTTKLSALDWWVYGLSVLAFLTLPALFLHLCLRFPVDMIARNKRAMLVYVPGVILAMLHIMVFSGHLAFLGLPRNAHSIGIIDNTELIYFVAGFIISGTLLLKRRLKTHDLIACQQMKWVSYGTLAGIFPFSLIYVIPVLLGIRSNFAMESSMLFLGLIPLSIGYAIIHYRLMDVEIIVKRSAAYFIASSLLFGAFIIFILILSKAFQWIAPEADFMPICIAVLVIALLFAPMHNSTQIWMDRLFYKDQFEDRSTLLDFARTLSSEMSLKPLSRIIAEKLIKTFRIEKAAIIMADTTNSEFFNLIYSSNLEMTDDSRLYKMNELIDHDQFSSISAVPKGIKNLHNAGPMLESRGFFYLQDLIIHGRNVGMLALGQLPKGRHFSTEDLDLLSGLARYAAIALENANLYCSVEAKAFELERMKAYTESILESINVAILALDFEGHITSCNRAFESLYEMTRAKIVGSGIEDIFPVDVISSIQNVSGIKGWQIRSPFNIFKLFIKNKAGKRLIVNFNMIPLQNAFRENAGSLLVLDDISEKTQMEDQLMQSEKLSSIGLLAAGIAHEVNTPIAGISSYTQMLLKETPETDKRKNILKKIEKQTFRAAEIVNGLLSFSRINDNEFNALDINKLITESLALLDHQLKNSHILVECSYEKLLLPVFGNAGKLQQVFLNLFLNAKDAMPSGGDLKIQTAMNDSLVIIDITDNGLGISEENLKKIFDPFFTTKAIGKGTGLGLAVSYGIIQEHGGRIFVNSDSGKGTHFIIKLPARVNQ
jgi:two-component system, NtrC family, sensor kinase